MRERSGWNLGKCSRDLNMEVQEDAGEEDPRGLEDLGAREEGVCERSQGRDGLVSDSGTWAGARSAWEHQ